MKIMIADANENDSAELSSLLEQLGHQSFMAQEGKEAIELFEELNPDLVFIDLNLPGLDSLSTIQQLRKTSFDIFDWKPVIFLSETDDDSTIMEIIDAGADDFLKKPVSIGLLKAKLKSMQRLMAMRQNLIDYGQQLRTVNDNLLSSTQLLNELSLKDPLTLIGNRRAFQDVFDKALRSAVRNGEPLSMVMIDIDFFKLYNDTLGHQTGDNCLKEVAQLFVNSMHRPKDFIARFGGEEFAVLLPETDLKGACQVAERLRRILEERKIEHPASSYRYVTASFGVACTIPFRGFNSEDLLKIADLALYQAKEEGRNCVVHCAETVESLKFHAEPPLQKYA